MAQLPPRPVDPDPKRRVSQRILNPSAYDKAMDAWINQLTNYIQPIPPMAPPTTSWPGGQGNVPPGSMGGGTPPTYGPGGPWNIPPVGSPQGVAGAIGNAASGASQFLNIAGTRGGDLYKAVRPITGSFHNPPSTVKQIVGGNLVQTGQNVGADLLNQLVSYYTTPSNYFNSAPGTGSPSLGPSHIPAPYDPSAPIGPGNVSPGAPGTGYYQPGYGQPQFPGMTPPIAPPAYDPGLMAPPGPDPAIGPALNPAIGAVPPYYPSIPGSTGAGSSLPLRP